MLPFAVTVYSAANHIRVGFLHKQSQEDKEIYAMSHGRQVFLSRALHISFWLMGQQSIPVLSKAFW